MSKTFAVMKTNVSNMIQDTSSSFKSLAGVWINDAYQDASRKYLWNELINSDYTFESVVDQNEYDLPADFEDEIWLSNIASARRIKRYMHKNWWQARWSIYNADSIPSGTPTRYMIQLESSELYLDPAPTVAETYAMPYKTTVTDLSADSDTSSIKNLEIYLEHYAMSQGYAYKKEFQKSDYYLNKAEFELQKLIDSKQDRANQTAQYFGADYNPLIGDNETIGDSNYGL